ncbi:MAG: ABC transporter permease subunit [Actinomycetota bacterium]|nr:ABC transporter permease subunit [Actinomycetota bacterium]
MTAPTGTASGTAPAVRRSSWLDVVRAELLKLRTTWLTLILLACSVAIAVLSVAATLATEGDGENQINLTDEELTDAVFGSAGIATIFALVMGIVIVTTEFRHQTITPSVLITPRRWPLIVAKFVAAALLGAVYAITTAVVVSVIGLPWLAIKDVTITSGDAIGSLSAAAVSVVLYGIVGVGVGALIRNQVAAIVGALAWTLVIESLAVALLPEVGRWLPGGAAGAIGAGDGSDLLEPWAGALVFVGYGVLFGVVGSLTTIRRDIT